MDKINNAKWTKSKLREQEKKLTSVSNGGFPQSIAYSIHPIAQISDSMPWPVIFCLNEGN